MKAVLQEEKNGCAIACIAAIKGMTYAAAKQTANSIGISADNSELWSSSKSIRALSSKLGLSLSPKEIPFANWDTLPVCALLATKWHLEKGKPYWHWVVFIRNNHRIAVLDSKKSLKSNLRTDFGRMKPKWFIEIL
jgi:ABC-type bacteriocin/lantibiotic exporter with double-glycine peptidase domain